MDKQTALKKMDKIAQPFIVFLTGGVVLALIALFASPILWAWHSWDLAWRIFVSALVSLYVFSQSLKVCKEILNEAKNEITDLIEKP
jgi:uncharacterized membrane protein YhfC